MKKIAYVLFSVALIFSLTSLAIPHATEAATKEVTYQNCKSLNAVYKNGVIKAQDTKNAVKNQKTKQVTYKASSAYISANLYNLNTKLDADKDGIACEK